MNRYTGLEFDQYVASYYIKKIKHCRTKQIEFKLTLTQVRNMLRAKRCQLSGIELSHPLFSDGSRQSTDVSIDRLDHNKPYETGNVCAVANIINSFKSRFENPNQGITLEALHHLRVTGNEEFGLDIDMIHTISKNLKKRGF